MVIASGRSARQLASMAQHLDEKLTKAGISKVNVEGLTQGEWVLLDGGDVIVHLFKPEIRRFYNLEKMWGVELPEPERMTAVG
jgi:ribosome-associated protein